MRISDDIRYVGVNDHAVDLFEGQYTVPNGMSYNSYVILDDKIAVMDTVDAHFTHEWMDNLQNLLGDRTPDYLVVQHMEPDHSANIANFMKLYTSATIVSSAKAFAMMEQFFGTDYADRRIVVGEGDTLPLGKHTLAFVTAPMVHWPEVIMTYDTADKVLFSAAGFGNACIHGFLNGGKQIHEAYRYIAAALHGNGSVLRRTATAGKSRYTQHKRRKHGKDSLERGHRSASFRRCTAGHFCRRRRTFLI